MESQLEYILTHRYKTEMIAHMRGHPGEFAELVQLALADKQPYSWRAAWLIWSIMEPNDERISPYIDKMIDILLFRKDGQARDLLMVLQKMDIPEEVEGKLFDISITLWEQIGKQPSVRLNAFKTILKIMRKYPELASEIEYLVQPHFMGTLSPGVKHSVSRLIAENKKK
jgi:hypothetical protein